MKRITELSTAELSARIRNFKYQLIDIRPIEAFNGWKLKGEVRGGHLPGAKSIPLKWTKYLDWVEVLEEKNISSGRPVIIYGYTADETAGMAEKLQALGYKNILIYNQFVQEWSADPERPLERLERYHKLVYPDWIRQLIHDENPPAYEGRNFVICHSHYGYPEDYLKGHIPGAVAMDTNTLESTDTWNRHSPDELNKALTNLGIRHDTTVVVYGRFSSPKYNEDPFPGKSAGHLGAIRCAALMMYAGVKDIRILNGGITSWEQESYDLSVEDNQTVPVENFGMDIPAHPEYMIDTPEARQLLASEEGELVSIRSWEEFTGIRSGYHYIDKKGRIPGAVFGNCGSDAYHMEKLPQL